MKYQLIALFVIFNLCYGIDDDIIVNNSTHGLPPDVPPEPLSTSTVDPNTTTASTTTVSPNTTTITTPTTPKTTTTPITTEPTTTTTTTTQKTTTTTITTSTTTPTTTTTIKTTTISPNTTTSKPTSLPSTTAAPVPPPSNRKFDGPSFVGGIILASGLMAIGFIAFKFYKARTELNYHTL